MINKDEIIITETELKTFLVKAFHGSDVDNCSGELVCTRMETYNDASFHSKMIKRCFHECQKCHQTVELEEQYPQKIYKKI